MSALLRHWSLFDPCRCVENNLPNTRTTHTHKSPSLLAGRPRPMMALSAWMMFFFNHFRLVLWWGRTYKNSTRLLASGRRHVTPPQPQRFVRHLCFGGEGGADAARWASPPPFCQIRRVQPCALVRLARGSGRASACCSSDVSIRRVCSLLSPH